MAKPRRNDQHDPTHSRSHAADASPRREGTVLAARRAAGLDDRRGVGRHAAAGVPSAGRGDGQRAGRVLAGASGRGHAGRRHKVLGRADPQRVNPDNGQSSIQFKTGNREQDPQRQDFRWVKDDAIRRLPIRPRSASWSVPRTATSTATLRASPVPICAPSGDAARVRKTAFPRRRKSARDSPRSPPSCSQPIAAVRCSTRSAAGFRYEIGGDRAVCRADLPPAQTRSAAADRSGRQIAELEPTATHQAAIRPARQPSSNGGWPICGERRHDDRRGGQGDARSPWSTLCDSTSRTPWASRRNAGTT